jgi:hypothetical protein
MTSLIKYQPQAVSFTDLERMATYFVDSGLFGIKTKAQAVTLMLLAQSEGIHPARAAQRYNIIQGRPSKRSEATHGDFLAAGGSIKWLELTDSTATAEFTHPQGGKVTIEWNMDRAKKAGLTGKDNWRKWPRQMLRARVISEGCKTVFPDATSGMYTPEEVQDFAPRKTIAVKSTPVKGPDELHTEKEIDAIKADIAAGLDIPAETIAVKVVEGNKVTYQHVVDNSIPPDLPEMKDKLKFLLGQICQMDKTTNLDEAFSTCMNKPGLKFERIDTVTKPKSVARLHKAIKVAVDILGLG